MTTIYRCDRCGHEQDTELCCEYGMIDRRFSSMELCESCTKEIGTHGDRATSEARAVFERIMAECPLKVTR